MSARGGRGRAPGGNGRFRSLIFATPAARACQSDPPEKTPSRPLICEVSRVATGRTRSPYLSSRQLIVVVRVTVRSDRAMSMYDCSSGAAGWPSGPNPSGPNPSPVGPVNSGLNDSPPGWPARGLFGSGTEFRTLNCVPSAKPTAGRTRSSNGTTRSNTVDRAASSSTYSNKPVAVICSWSNFVNPSPTIRIEDRACRTWSSTAGSPTPNDRPAISRWSSRSTTTRPGNSRGSLSSWFNARLRSRSTVRYVGTDV